MTDQSNVVPIRKEWVAIWRGQVHGADRWIVEAYIDGGSLIVADCRTEQEARCDAAGWGLPVVMVA